MSALLIGLRAVGAALLAGIGASIAKLLTAEMFEQLVLAYMGYWLDGAKAKALKTPEKVDDMRVARIEKVFIYIREQWTNK